MNLATFVGGTREVRRRGCSFAFREEKSEGRSGRRSRWLVRHESLIKRKDRHEDAVVAAMRGSTLVCGIGRRGYRRYRGCSRQRTKTPLDVSVVEADVLPFAFVGLAVHQFHICAVGRFQLMFLKRQCIIAVGPERTSRDAGEYL